MLTAKMVDRIKKDAPSHAWDTFKNNHFYNIIDLHTSHGANIDHESILHIRS